jgi:glycerophosphoryl diester phosphodiesterase
MTKHSCTPLGKVSWPPLVVLLLALLLTHLTNSFATTAPSGPAADRITDQKRPKIVIASRGASGYLMEHNIPSTALAIGLGSDFIEMELVMTKDNQVIVLREPTLNQVTNVAEIFPERARKDGKYYALDFTLAEIKQLSLKEPYPNGRQGEERFPDDRNSNLRFTVPTFKEELELIRGLEKTLRRAIGIYPEIKTPWLHRHEGKDISLAVIKILKEYGYTSAESSLLLQCFDHDELQRIRTEILPAQQMELQLIQLIDDNNGNETKSLEFGEWVSYNYDWMLSKSGLRALSLSVAGIGLDKSLLVDPAGALVRPTLVDDAHSLGLVVHSWLFRREQESIPPYIQGKKEVPGTDFETLLDFFFFKVGVDGIFTDYCGDAASFLAHRPTTAKEPESSPATTIPPESGPAASAALPAQTLTSPDTSQPLPPPLPPLPQAPSGAQPATISYPTPAPNPEPTPTANDIKYR